MSRPRKLLRSGRLGNAGVIATFAIALAGVIIGAASTYFGERGAAARAAREEALTQYQPAQSIEEMAFQAREKIVQSVLAGSAPERLPAPPIMDGSGGQKPKIIIIVDDMGLDPAMVEQVAALPGPLTLSFLPYAGNVKQLVRQARDSGADIMLHLPMQPQGEADPGPKALRAGMTGAEFIKTLEWNLDQFPDYIAVNNHMGSSLTADEAAMKTILAYLKHKGVFFIDSVTTGGTVVRSAGAMVGATVYSRDVFLDAEIDNRQAVAEQLALTERIARETGFALAICHPRQATLDVLGPWLVSAPFRGFEITTVRALADIHERYKPAVLAQAPALRL
ncbi:MAG: divergent polysaccharide deacetylase family protein [Hyphococcus sp.]